MSCRVSRLNGFEDAASRNGRRECWNEAFDGLTVGLAPSSGMAGTK